MRTYKSKKYICIDYLYNFFDQNIVLLHLYKITNDNCSYCKNNISKRFVSCVLCKKSCIVTVVKKNRGVWQSLAQTIVECCREESEVNQDTE